MAKAAACPPAPDASCPPGDFEITNLWTVAGAQTFTELNGGHLTAAEFMLKLQLDLSAILELRLTPVDPGTGLPHDASSLAVTERAANTVPFNQFAWVRFTFPAPPKLNPARQYALMLTVRGGLGGQEYVHQSSNTNEDCPGGGYFVRIEPGDDWIPAIPRIDVAYRTFVRR